MDSIRNVLCDIFSRVLWGTPWSVPSIFQAERFMEDIRRGDEDGVRAFIKKYPKQFDEQMYSGTTALYQAVDAGQAKMVDLLLQAGARPDIRAWSDTQPLYWACLQDQVDFDIVRSLLQHGATPSDKSGILSSMDLAQIYHAKGDSRLLDMIGDEFDRRLKAHQAAELARAREKEAEQEKIRKETEAALTEGVVPDARMRVRIKLKR